MARATEREMKEAKEELHRLLIPGDTVYTILRHVSRSGMYRVIDLFIIRNDKPIRFSWTAAKLLEGYDRRHDGCRTGGCGMDMGFHLVNNLSYVLFGDGYALKQSWL